MEKDLRLSFHSHCYPTREQSMDAIEDVELDIKLHFEHSTKMHCQSDI